MRTVPLDVVQASPYVAYSYSYPHKTAYRPLPAPLPLADVWRDEDHERLFLYAHVPFCRMRCGFCNLFTMTKPGRNLPGQYLDALRRQARAAQRALRSPRFARVAVGGGTPTFLDVRELSVLFDVLEHELGARIADVPSSIETSPDTLTPDHAALIADRGFDRVSIGIQTFAEDEARLLGRPQPNRLAHRSLEILREAGVPCLNVDLIYGGDGQTPASWERTLGEALRHRPEEIYLYPLYVRPRTTLGLLDRAWDDNRLAAYRAARDRLAGEGYRQISMRMFRRSDAPGDEAAPVYCCQADGMVGLGPGARSYTSALHYSTDYAVGRTGVRDIVEAYCETDEAGFSAVAHGFRLDADEQRRRHVILSLLQAEGLDRRAFRHRFGADAVDAFPELLALEEAGLAEIDEDRAVLTPEGLERSDAVGPLFYSPETSRLSEAYEWR